jgi:hypothetical protein
MEKVILILAMIFVFCGNVSSKETKKIDPTLENISGQYAECAAYYRFAYHAMNSSNEKEKANVFSQLEDTAIFYSLLLANEGRSKDIAFEVTNSRIEMYMKKMKQEANNRNENISILINKYHFQCNEALKDPKKYISLSKEKLGKKVKK